MDVIILAGGLGTRLRSVVSEVPKCMAPVATRPFLYYLLNYLSENYSANTLSPDTRSSDALSPESKLLGSVRIERVVLSVGYLREKIYEWIDECASSLPFEIHYAVEEQPLGTGGGIRLALEQCKADHVAILNGDTFFDVDLTDFSNFHIQNGAMLSVALKPMDHFSRYGNVEVSDNGMITAFNEKCYCERGLINGGVYLANRVALLDFLASKPEKFSFEKEVLEVCAAPGNYAKLAGFVCNGYFIDIGIPEDYTRADREFKIASGQITSEIVAWVKSSSASNCSQDSENSLGNPIYDTLFLDRDGVINRLRVDDYVKCIEEFEFLPGVLHAIAEWSRMFTRVIVVTNQRGVGKGVMSLASLNEIHEYMVNKVVSVGGRINAIYFSTALTNDDYNRKPNPGMSKQALKDFPDIDLSASLMIGDSKSDEEFAVNSGIGRFVCV